MSGLLEHSLGKWETQAEKAVLLLLTEYLPAGRELGDDVDHVLGGHDLVELDDVGVVEELHDLHLAVDLLQVGLVQLALVDDLDGHLEGGRRRRY